MHTPHIVHRFKAKSPYLVAARDRNECGEWEARRASVFATAYSQWRTSDSGGDGIRHSASCRSTIAPRPSSATNHSNNMDEFQSCVSAISRIPTWKERGLRKEVPHAMIGAESLCIESSKLRTRSIGVICRSIWYGMEKATDVELWMYIVMRI